MEDNKLEIGVTYFQNGKYYVAVKENMLAGFKNGRLIKRKPNVNKIPHRNITVTELCRRWDINDEKLHELSQEFFTPDHCRDQNPSNRVSRNKDLSRMPPIRVVSIAS